MKKVFYFGCVFYFFIGTIHVFFGSLTPYLLSSYDKGPGELSSLIFFQFIGFLTGVLLSPILVRKRGYGAVLTMGLLLMIGSLLLGLLVPGWTTLVLAGFFLGSGAGSLETTAGAYVISMANSAKRISIMEVFFGLGALLFPLVILLTVTEQTWQYVFLFQVGALTFFLMLWLVFMNKLPHGQMDAPSTGEMRKPSLLVDRKNRMIVVIMICFAFFYAGIETNFANFLPSIMLEKGGENWGLFAVSTFWTAIVIGRTVIARKADQLHPLRFLKLSASLMILLLVIFALTTHITAQLILIFFIGLCAAGMFPIALTASALMIENAIDEATSYFIAAASLGGACLSFLIGFSLEWAGAASAVFVFAFLAVLLFVAAIQMNRSKKKETVHPQQTELKG
ncbi:MFS transporter [Bacillus safensis]|uniref:MFS transporter n=1 Tax=Bacillus TaxID=1386 RepID=UPI0007517E01|nr:MULTISPECIES: MFS transporter [Bacillus]MBW4848959.1 MFS transporter [Bacillaceae bacterium]KUR62550.1 MFS transporter [Bacillus sp. AM 13(2015)]MBU5207762.1 MFS transporter [Bacillus safensis]MBW4853512.1 MFS transporter [Bacillaceae bacterium]MBW4857105.1 MFS transporter [Bacillaceae bacterium]